MSYDYIIVGGGPVGLTLAWLLANDIKKHGKILIIEREDTIGGCHRVRRQDGLFTEHGPRIYGNNYLNFKQVLESMGINFEKIFTPYQFTTFGMGQNVISKLAKFSIREVLLLGLEFFKLIIYPSYGKNLSVLQFMNQNNFSELGQRELDRVCRLTDGAGADRYTMWELLGIFDQHIFYKFMQPRRPNDVYLLPMWKQKLEETGQVQFLLGAEAQRVTWGQGKVNGVVIKNSQGTYEIGGKEVILAMPPENVSKIVPWGTSLPKLKATSNYDTYIPVVFHWDKKLKLRKIWGFPTTEWGVINILLSDYTTFDDPRSQTVITTCITMTDQVSTQTGKTANQTTNSKELVVEVFRQLSMVYGGLPYPTASILSPGVYREQGRWQTWDSAFVYTARGEFLPEFNHPQIKGLYWVGTHNGKSYYHFTSMESAVSNAMAFFLEKFPDARKKYQLKKPYNLTDILRLIIATVIVFMAVYYRRRILKLS